MKIILLVLLSSSFSIAEVTLKDSPTKEIYQDCQNCHQTKVLQNVPRMHQPLREHSHIELIHGNKKMSCNHCHDKTNHNFLREKASFQAPSTVCFQCHSDVQSSWQKGIHGKRVGGWKGARVQLHCTECHNAHSVTFPQWKAVKPPQRPKYSIPKTEKH